MKHLVNLLFIMILSGCQILNPEIQYPDSNSRISAVLVVVEDSYIGRNPGAIADLNMMTNMLHDITDDIVILKNGIATRQNVKESITRACSNDLAIIFFTCHGGQQKAKKNDRDFEVDGKDEFIYLSDSSISDNELWDIFKNSTNRIFTIFNCCHSGTMFRTSLKGQDETNDMTFEPFKSTNGKSSVNLLSWSACADGCYAASYDEGSMFISSIYRTFKAFDGDVSYNQAWTTISISRDLRIYQKPIVNTVGEYSKFRDVPLFR